MKKVQAAYRMEKIISFVPRNSKANRNKNQLNMTKNEKFRIIL